MDIGLEGDDKIKVYKTKIIKLKGNISNSSLDYLYKCNKESAIVWNECIKLNKELWKTKGEYSDRKYLQDSLKGFSNILPAKCIQIIIKRYLSSLVGIRKARKQGRIDMKFTWRYKKVFNTIWDKQMIKVVDNYILLSKPMICGKQQKPIKIFSKNIPSNIVQIELIYNDGLQLAINYWIEEEYIQINSNYISAIDLGEIHSITSVDTVGNSLIITGRQLRSYQRFRNKELGVLQKKLRKCKKGSRNYKKYRKAIRKLMSKSERKVNNDLHKTSKIYSDYCVCNNIKTVIVGDLTKFNMNLNQTYGNKQKLVQWQHGKLVNLIKYKVEKYGIDVAEISEAYTSQTCPNCGNKHKPMSRNYVCKECGFSMHRDLVGACNILSKYINNGKILNLKLELKPLKYLRIA